MQWHKKIFQVQDGTRFTVVHAFSDANIDTAFQTWADTHYSVDESTDPEGDFIRYIKAHDKSGLINIVSLEDFAAMSVSDEITDKSRMPFGKHKGEKMIDIPSEYLIAIYNKGYIHHAGVEKYVIDNMAVLKSQSKFIRK